MADIDRNTGQVISGEQSVLQSVEIIFSTRIGEVVMLRHFGAGIVELLGRSMTPQLFAAFQMLIVVAVQRWEPRLKIRGVYPKISASSIELGQAGVRIEADYMPNGHKGDFTVQKVLQFGLAAFNNGMAVET